MAFDVERARRATPASERHVHLNNAGAALQPDPVLHAVRAHLDLEAELGGYEAAGIAADEIRGVYESIANLLHAGADEIALVDSATRAWLTAFMAIPFEQGDRILTSSSEYASNAIAYLQAAEREGVEVVEVPNDEDGALSVDELSRLMDERVKLVSITHVPTSSGLVNDVAAVGRVVAGSNALYLVDACQSAGQMPLDVAAIGCHLLSATGRKYLRGPRGTGFLYVDRDRLDDLRPVAADLHSATWIAPGAYQLREGAGRFELWERSVATMLGLGAAVDHALSFGIDETYERVRRLADRLRTLLADVSAVTVRDVGRERCGIVTFTLDGVAPTDLTRTLQGVGIHIWHIERASSRTDMTEQGLEAVSRASVHAYNTDAELEALGAALTEVGR